MLNKTDSKTAKIITICDLNNYGNRLQNYAVQKVISQMGYKTATVWYVKNKYRGKKLLKYFIHKILLFQVRSGRRWQLERMRYKAFVKFNKHHINTDNIKTIQNIQCADYYIVGSDQVWNPRWYDEEPLKKDLFLLTFTEPAKKVCFSPSFGEDDILDTWKSWFADYLKEFRYISVREEAGADIVHKLTDKEAETLIDPTLMLNNDDWLEIAVPIKNMKLRKPYVLTYFLGEHPQEAEDIINRLKSESDYDVHRLMDELDKDMYCAGPSEWLWLISHADLVLTDSYHACVFSFIFEIPFLVFNRESKDMGNMNSRLNTLLSLLDLERKHVGSGLENDLFEHDYAAGKARLRTERIRVYEFLRKSMQ